MTATEVSLVTIGSRVGRLLGSRLERFAVDRYRRLFVDLEALAGIIAGLGTYATLIEVGCGEGALMTHLTEALGPDTSALGIDIAPNPGGGYTGRADNVTFRQASAAEVAADGHRFELVVVSDVLHYVPPDDRRRFLESCRQLLAPNGTIVVKDWVRRRNFAHLAARGSDRFISGHKGIQYYTEDELRAVFEVVYCSTGTRPFASHVRPHWNNVVLAARRVSSAD